MDHSKSMEIKELGSTLLEIGAMLMSSGASTGRIRNTIGRISGAFGYNTELLITHRALMLTIRDEQQDNFFSSLKRTSPHGVNFKVVSGISRMSWHIVEEKWPVSRINEELDRLSLLPHYPRLIILTFVALAGASFCRLFGGNPLDMVIAFIATFAGLFVRQESVKAGFNPYLCIFFASLTASLLAGFYVKFFAGSTHEYAFATSVLFLVPGVPLINSFSDLIDGNILNGIVRGINGLIISFAIALGLLSAMLIYHI